MNPRPVPPGKNIWNHRYSSYGNSSTGSRYQSCPDLQFLDDEFIQFGGASCDNQSRNSPIITFLENPSSPINNYRNSENYQRGEFEYEQLRRKPNLQEKNLQNHQKKHFQPQQTNQGKRNEQQQPINTPISGRYNSSTGMRFIDEGLMGSGASPCNNQSRNSPIITFLENPSSPINNYRNSENYQREEFEYEQLRRKPNLQEKNLQNHQQKHFQPQQTNQGKRNEQQQPINTPISGRYNSSTGMRFIDEGLMGSRASSCNNQSLNSPIITFPENTSSPINNYPYFENYRHREFEYEQLKKKPKLHEYDQRNYEQEQLRKQQQTKQRTANEQQQQTNYQKLQRSANYYPNYSMRNSNPQRNFFFNNNKNRNDGSSGKTRAGRYLNYRNARYGNIKKDKPNGDGYISKGKSYQGMGTNNIHLHLHLND